MTRLPTCLFSYLGDGTGAGQGNRSRDVGGFLEPQVGCPEHHNDERRSRQFESSDR